MTSGRRCGLTGIFLAMALLMGAGSLLSACNTVAGAGRDVQDLGRNIQSDANAARPR